jgi:putative transposase
MKAIEELVVRMAGENPRWGYTRIQGALSNIGHRVARATVANILKREGIDPRQYEAGARCGRCF